MKYIMEENFTDERKMFDEDLMLECTGDSENHDQNQVELCRQTENSHIS